MTRLLAEARRTGIVEIRIHSEASPYADLELDVARRFGLDEAIIVPAMKAPEQQRESLAIAVAGYLQRVLRDGMVVAIGISRTIGLVADNIVDPRPVGCTFVSVTGSRSRSAEGVNAHEATDRLARLFGASARNIPAPVYAATKELRDAFVCDPAIARPLEQAAGADLILVGAGGLGSQLLVSGGEIQDDQLKELVAAGAVGDIAARFFDASGRAVEHDLDQRLIGLTLAQIAGIRTRVVAAGGTEKVAALEVSARRRARDGARDRRRHRGGADPRGCAAGSDRRPHAADRRRSRSDRQCLAIREHDHLAGRRLQPRGGHVGRRHRRQRLAQDLALVRARDDEQDLARRQHGGETARQRLARHVVLAAPVARVAAQACRASAARGASGRRARWAAR